MAMLAEPRRKQKWSVDPRNSSWSKDESKFGQKMLEKMGWSKGKGLGAQEQGNTEHIKVQVKNNSLGLGASVNHEDNWIAHQDDFNQLLADLNNCHGQDGAESASREQKKTFNLEEKSKISRKRVHYVKFAKGKDLSSRSEDDLSCIFGKRKKTLAHAAAADSVAQDPKAGNDPPEDVDTSNTVTSVLTVQEYFAKRMAKLKKARNGGDIMPSDPPPVMAEEWEHLGSQSKKKKKEKNHKQAQPANEDSQEEPKLKCLRVLDSSGEEVDELDTKKPKKKKSKYTGLGDSHMSNEFQQGGTQERGSYFTGTSSVENSDSEVPKPKKKNKKKHKKQNIDEDVEEGTRRKKKKKQSS